MERVAFLIEHTGERIRCLLNPESLLLQRCSGIKSRSIVSNIVSGLDINDDQLIHTGGGQTYLTLNLLFDVDVAKGSSVVTSDVRELTAPIWALSENQQIDTNRRQLPVCRFFWGKWNMPAVVESIAENLDKFTIEGVPQRSWMRMRLRRVSEEKVPAVGATSRANAVESLGSGSSPTLIDAQENIGAQVSGERLDQLAYQHYGDSSLWREIAATNDLDDPFDIEEGKVIDLPSLSELLDEYIP